MKRIVPKGLLVSLFAIASLVMAGCYTQIAKPGVDRDEERTVIRERNQEVESEPQEEYSEEEYGEEEQGYYEEGEQDRGRVNIINNYYGGFYYDPFWDPIWDPYWYSWRRYPRRTGLFIGIGFGYGYAYSHYDGWCGTPWYWADPWCDGLFYGTPYVWNSPVIVHYPYPPYYGYPVTIRTVEVKKRQFGRRGSGRRLARGSSAIPASTTGSKPTSISKRGRAGEEGVRKPPVRRTPKTYTGSRTVTKGGSEAVHRGRRRTRSGRNAGDGKATVKRRSGSRTPAVKSPAPKSRRKSSPKSTVKRRARVSKARATSKRLSRALPSRSWGKRFSSSHATRSSRRTIHRATPARSSSRHSISRPTFSRSAANRVSRARVPRISGRSAPAPRASHSSGKSSTGSRGSRRSRK